MNHAVTLLVSRRGSLQIPALYGRRRLACSRLNSKAACAALRLSRIAGATPGPEEPLRKDLSPPRAGVQCAGEEWSGTSESELEGRPEAPCRWWRIRARRTTPWWIHEGSDQCRTDAPTTQGGTVVKQHVPDVQQTSRVRVPRHYQDVGGDRRTDDVRV